METQALQEDRAQEQLQKDNRELLQKIQVSDINVFGPKLDTTTIRTLQRIEHSACVNLEKKNILSPNGFEPMKSHIPGRRVGVGLCSNH